MGSKPERCEECGRTRRQCRARLGVMIARTLGNPMEPWPTPKKYMKEVAQRAHYG